MCRSRRGRRWENQRGFAILHDVTWLTSICLSVPSRSTSYNSVNELQFAVYPKDATTPICACFGFTLEDIEADVRQGTPIRIRELLAKSKSADAQCHTLAADGRCCMREVQRLYMKLIAEPG